MIKESINKLGILKFIPVFIIGIILCSGFSSIMPETSFEDLLNDNLNKIVQDTTAQTKIDQNPSFRGNMNKWLRENLIYPPKAVKKNIQGKVSVKFMVEKDGTLSNVEVIKGVEASLDKEAIRVIKTMPAWNPGIKDGEFIRVEHTLPIVFKLQTPKKK